MLWITIVHITVLTLRGTPRHPWKDFKTPRLRITGLVDFLLMCTSNQRAPNIFCHCCTDWSTYTSCMSGRDVIFFSNTNPSGTQLYQYNCPYAGLFCAISYTSITRVAKPSLCWQGLYLFSNRKSYIDVPIWEGHTTFFLLLFQYANN